MGYTSPAAFHDEQQRIIATDTDGDDTAREQLD